MFCLIFTEIAKVRASLFQINGVKKDPLVLPEPEGMITTLTEKVYVPVKEHPDVSFLSICNIKLYLKTLMGLIIESFDFISLLPDYKFVLNLDQFCWS